MGTLWLWRFLPGVPITFIGGIALIELHGPANQVIFVNPAEITSIREPTVADHFARGTKCLVYFSNRNFITVTENCITVRKKLIAAQP